MNEADRFWAKVRRMPGGGCWVWTASKSHGYGFFHRMKDGRRRPDRAHRVAWELTNGPIPDGLWVLHKCDNPPCVRPDHLFLGDRRDNMLDAAAKGRIRTIGKSRLTRCKQGHEFTASNTYRDGKGHRRCIVCRDALRRASYPRERAAAPPPCGCRHKKDRHEGGDGECRALVSVPPGRTQPCGCLGYIAAAIRARSRETGKP